MGELPSGASRLGGPSIRTRILALLAETGHPLRVDSVAALLSLRGELPVTTAQVNAVVGREKVRRLKRGEQVTLAACLRPEGMLHAGFVAQSDWPLNQRVIGLRTLRLRHLQALRLQLIIVRAMDRHLADVVMIWRLTSTVHRDLGSPSIQPPRDLADITNDERATYLDQVIKALEAALATLEPLDRSDRTTAEHALVQRIRDEDSLWGQPPLHIAEGGPYDSKK